MAEQEREYASLDEMYRAAVVSKEGEGKSIEEVCVSLAMSAYGCIYLCN